MKKMNINEQKETKLFGMRPHIFGMIEKIANENSHLFMPSGSDADMINDFFLDAMSLAFDINDHNFMNSLQDQDWLDVPSVGNKRYNYFQLAMFGKPDRNEPVPTIFCYLFTDMEPNSDEPWDFSESEAKARPQFHQKLRVTYVDAAEYLARVEYMLFLAKGDLDKYLSWVYDAVWNREALERKAAEEKMRKPKFKTYLKF